MQRKLRRSLNFTFLTSSLRSGIPDPIGFRWTLDNNLFIDGEDGTVGNFTVDETVDEYGYHEVR